MSSGAAPGSLDSLDIELDRHGDYGDNLDPFGGTDMSRSWSKGSTPAWRRLRLRILHRDEFQCQLQLPGCTGRHRFDLVAKGAAHVHHMRGKAYGDDPAHLVTACRACNLAVGDPNRQQTPQPTPRSNW